MEEVWKDIVGYEGLYQVSNIGRVKSLDHYASNGVKIILYSGRVLKQTKNKNGYYSVMFSKNSETKRKYVHRLVAEAFIENPNNLNEVNHKDESRTNNCVDNLEWCDRNYNLNYGRLQEKSAITRGIPVLQYDMSGTFIAEYYSIRNAAKMIGRKHGDVPIGECCKGKRKQAYGYIWRYKEAE